MLTNRCPCPLPVASLLIILFTTFQGAFVGWIESVYCRTHAVFPEPDVDDADAIRRLAVAGGGTSGGAGGALARVAAQTLPLFYTDPDCPFSKFGAFNKCATCSPPATPCTG